MIGAGPMRLALYWLGGAALVGGIAGAGSIVLEDGGTDRVIEVVKPTLVAIGAMRERAPQAGDHWAGCNEARAAGTAPIYIGEPGYREEMDGDNDGIACEPYRGR